MTRRISAAGLSHIKKWEGCKLKAYRDVAGVLTIGYGSTGKHVKPGMVITEAEAEALLRKDLDRFEKAVARLVTVKLTDNQFAALVSFAFNVGNGAFEESTLLRKLNDGNYSAVPSELMKWVNAGGRKVQGLVNRREAEGALWRSQSPVRPVPASPAPEVAPKPKPAPEPVQRSIWAGLLAFILKLFGRNPK